jgi:hypothetical protein
MTICFLSLAGCAIFAPAKSAMTPDCSGLGEQKCNRLKTSSSFCCDQSHGWECNFGGKAADSPYPGQCEYDGSDSQQPTTWCGGPLGCEGARRPDAGDAGDTGG